MCTRVCFSIWKLLKNCLLFSNFLNTIFQNLDSTKVTSITKSNPFEKITPVTKSNTSENIFALGLFLGDSDFIIRLSLGLLLAGHNIYSRCGLHYTKVWPKHNFLGVTTHKHHLFCQKNSNDMI